MQINPKKLQEKLLWCFLVVLSPDNKISKVAKNWSIRKAKIWPQIFVYPRSLCSNCWTVVTIELLNLALWPTIISQWIL